MTEVLQKQFFTLWFKFFFGRSRDFAIALAFTSD